MNRELKKSVAELAGAIVELSRLQQEYELSRTCAPENEVARMLSTMRCWAQKKEEAYENVRRLSSCVRPEQRLRVSLRSDLGVQQTGGV
jgi:hypothetical protein